MSTSTIIGMCALALLFENIVVAALAIRWARSHPGAATAIAAAVDKTEKKI